MNKFCTSSVIAMVYKVNKNQKYQDLHGLQELLVRLAENTYNHMEISGSQGIAGAADTIFSLKRERNSVVGVLHRTGRDVEEKDFMMKLEGYGWMLQGDVEDFIMPEWKKQILDFLKENPTVSPMQLSEKYSISHNAARTNLCRLAKEGLIVKTGYGTYGLPD